MERALEIFTGSRNGDREREIEMELRQTFPDCVKFRFRFFCKY